MNELTITAICRLLESRGDQRLDPSPVSLLEHALQTAWRAERDSAAASLVCACLLHDIGHVLDLLPGAARGAHGRHDEDGAACLGSLFDAAVTDPIRLHVSAKRYLCYAHPGYSHGLSADARRSLERQGGVFTAGEARAFMQERYAIDAVNLRLWDDQAHEPGASTPSLAHFAATLRRCVLPKRELSSAAPRS
jgi:predicted HD phosphohydrolase